MPRPMLRLATRLTRRTRLTAWAIGFACMVLVGSLSLIDGMSAGVDSVAPRFQTAPYVYLRGQDLLASSIDAAKLAAIPGNYSVLRVRVGNLTVGGISIAVVVASLDVHAGGNTTALFSGGTDSVALDTGLVQEVGDTVGPPAPTAVNLTVSGHAFANLSVAPPPSTRPPLLPATWAWVDPALLVAADSTSGASVQAVVTDAPLDPSLAATLGVAPLNTVGAIGFVQGSVSEARSALAALSIVVGAVIVLLVMSAMGLEVRQREAEIRTLRSLGASPRIVSAVIGTRALLVALLGATLGSALGIGVAHAVVSFAPVAGLPSLILLAPPYGAVLLAYATAVLASLVGAAVPAHRAALIARKAREAVSS